MDSSLKILLLYLLLSARVCAQEGTFVSDYLDSSMISSVNKQPRSLEVNGFLESRVGGRLSNEARDFTNLAEARLQFEGEQTIGPLTMAMVSDLILDPFTWRRRSQWSEDARNPGEGVIDLRQMNILFSPTSNLDVSLGRQIMTWGTGDLVFINDLFPKDFRSFFLGRDDEYLKAPANMAKISLFSNFANLELIYTPQFAPDRFIDGSRVSFFDRSIDGIRDRSNQLTVEIPRKWFEDDEVSVRCYRSMGRYEGALYYYGGFWKSPAAQDSVSGKALLPPLQVFGASIRGPLSDGIINLEGGYYRSPRGQVETRDQIRALFGYEIELGKDFTLGVQYFFERAFKEVQWIGPNRVGKRNRTRDLFTLRVTKLWLNQNLRISIFNFFSPTDQDGYLRCQSSYKLSDTFKVELGSNLFYGQERFTFFNQFSSSSNIYFGLRYMF